MRKAYLLLTGASAILFLLGFPPFPRTGTSWAAFIPLFLLTVQARTKAGPLALSTFCAGLVYYGILFYWLVYYETWLYVLILLIAAPAFPIYFLTFRWLTSKIETAFARSLTASFLWVALYQVYRLTPIGSVSFEAPFYGSLGAYQIASVSGFIGFAGLQMGLNAALALGLVKKNWRAFGSALTFLILVSAVILWGKNRLRPSPEAPEVKVILLQHNLPFDMEWREENPDIIQSRYEALAEEARRRNSQLIVFPLYTFPDKLLTDLEGFLSRLALRGHSHLLLATHLPTVPGEGAFSDFLLEIGEAGFVNTAFLYSPEGEKMAAYEAIQARPFQDLLEEALQLRAPEYELLPSPFGKLGVLLCYENVTPEVARKAVEKGAEILFALSNTGEFSTTHLPHYHLIQDQLRAIETHRWLVRVTPNGPSAVMDPQGRILQKSRVNEEEIIEGAVGRSGETTPFQKFPWALAMVSWICVGVVGILNLRRKVSL